MQIITNSPRETADFGFKLAKRVRGGEIYALIGDLGGGKTCFTKGFAKGLGIKRLIISPSFILMKIYKVRLGKVKFFCHIDAYRLKRSGEILEVGVKEFLGRADTITVIEWANKIKNVLGPYKKTKLNFSFVDKNSRKIIIKKLAKVK